MQKINPLPVIFCVLTAMVLATAFQNCSPVLVTQTAKKTSPVSPSP